MQTRSVIKIKINTYLNLEQKLRARMHHLPKTQRTKAKQQLKNERSRVVELIFKHLPDLQKPHDLDSLSEGRFFMFLVEAWWERLQKDELEYWDFLKEKEKRLYLFFRSELRNSLTPKQKRLCAKLPIKRDYKLTQQASVSDFDNKQVTKLIRKTLSKSKDEKWDYNNTDWDVT